MSLEPCRLLVVPPAAVVLVAVVATAVPGTGVDAVLAAGAAAGSAAAVRPAVGLAESLLGAVVAVVADQLSPDLHQEAEVVAAPVLPAAAPPVVSPLCQNHHLPLCLFPRGLMLLFPAVARGRPVDLDRLHCSVPASSAVFCHG